MVKEIFGFANAFVFFMILFSAVGIKAQTATIPSGSGTSSDPYKIATLDNLYWLSQTTSAWAAGTYFIQTANIDASSTSGWDSGAGFSPIGSTSILFQGNYNGKGHTIDALYINRPTLDRLGLFGTISYTNVDSLGLTNVNITGGTGAVGAVLAINRGSTISNCYSTGTITSNAASVGGIIGYNNSYCTVSNCYSTISISGSGSTNVGGLVGINYSDGTGSGTVSNCYAIGAITSSATYLGGFCGNNNGTITGSFWNTDIISTGIGTGTTTGATGKNTSQMKTESTFTNAGWDFKGETTNGTQDIWNINTYDNSAYPFLSWQYPNEPGQTMPQGSGTSADPYQIATLDNLYWVTQNGSSWGKYFKQTADIDASSSSSWSGGFPPIGGSSYFSGNYDGGGHTISGIYINNSSLDFAALFAAIEYYAVIKNLGVTNVNITGNNNVGAIVGFGFGGTIDNCYSTGSVKGDSTVGGIIGYAASAVSFSNSYIFNMTGCYSTASVSANYEAGGLIGDASGNTSDTTSFKLTYCYSSGLLSCPTIAGGITGKVTNGFISNSYSTKTLYCKITAGGIAGTGSGATISNCYYYGYLYFNSGTGNQDGGLVGVNNSGTINNCYAVVNNNVTYGIDLATYQIGGLVGLNGSGTTTNSFWDEDYSGLNYSAGGTGKTTTQMKTSSTFLNAGWSSSVWYRDNSYNSGYPYLAWQHPSGTPLPVELTSFTATINKNKVELNWKTVTEVNNYGFEIQRKINNSQLIMNNWEKIGFVKGSGTSNSAKEYSYTDDK